ncbi:MAG: hypothetical protein AB7U85_05115 [Alphaproteobacteria bacterium]
MSVTYELRAHTRSIDAPQTTLMHSGYDLLITNDDGSLTVKAIDLIVVDGNIDFAFVESSGQTYIDNQGNEIIWGVKTYVNDRERDTTQEFITNYNAQTFIFFQGNDALRAYNKLVFDAKLRSSLSTSFGLLDYDATGPNCNTWTQTMASTYFNGINVFDTFDGQFPGRFSSFIDGNTGQDVLIATAIRDMSAVFFNNYEGALTDLENVTFEWMGDESYTDSENRDVSLKITVGNKSYFIGENLNNTIIGTTSDDKIIGLAGNDVLNGGAGNDTYVFNSGDGEDTIFDDSGDNDSIVVNEDIADYNAYRSGDDLVIENTTGDKITVTDNFDGNAIEKISFNNNSDIIYGTSSAKTLNGGIGDDILLGGTENNIYQFVAGDGEDRIYDESGTDTIKITGNIEDYVETSSDNDLVINKIDSQDQIKSHFKIAS